ncbi:hypothetical protein [Paenibacillus radicis (ex Gao et al. 2016)]|uniref:Uncharacterized protein n=1 Tax=Paenibacillus radicis (ex Gao et al. 2016) TaxID=1737354 RepID=A0A917LS01_9BACL|nr:hypothetical protein [Paenibacillus radicis (ex Gao et al. 2016)]GGG53589.1 hypothetical protein GCM10010918_02880 [Paenibacillus radicis (ex Gao et al. 2016)]
MKGWFRRFSVSLALLSIMNVGGATALSSNINNSGLTAFNQGETAITNTSGADPDFDPKAAVGEDVLKQLKQASPDAVLSRNPSTGETIVTDRKPVRPVNSLGTELSTPSSLDSADERH